MCGIVGFLGALEDIEPDTCLNAMSAALVHRGPDSSGVWLSVDKRVGLAHRRLAILDLSAAGHQPMLSANQSWAITFNGEIYNHLELRSLLPKTIVWRGHSDTETLLCAFEHWGFENTLKSCVGMFAIAAWHLPSETLYLARDRFGEKPLYWTAREGVFAFSSELMSLMQGGVAPRDIDMNALGMYFKYLYIPSPCSIYKSVKKLPPANWISVTIDKGGAVQVSEPTAYWDYRSVALSGLNAPFQDEIEAIAQLECALTAAVKGQSLADVPLGAFLSGGVDSSLIVALMQAESCKSVNTFTVGFDVKAYDESEHARAVAVHLGTNHHELQVSEKDALGVIPMLAGMYGEPFADSSQIPTYFVCKAARQHATVALSGDAGDELFGGYNRYVWASRIWKKLEPFGKSGRNALAWGIELLSPAAWDKLAAHGNQQNVIRVGEKFHKLASRIRDTDCIDGFYESLVSEWRYPHTLLNGQIRLSRLDNGHLSNPIDRMMVNDAMGYLPGDILTKVDRAAMSVSLETRAPFLDHRVAELAWRLPLDMKLRGGVGKWALRQILYKYVPRELIERPKAGFAIPLMQWLRGPLKEWAHSLIEPSALNAHGLLNSVLIKQIWDEHQSGRYDHSAKIWSVLMFQSWYFTQHLG